MQAAEQAFTAAAIRSLGDAAMDADHAELARLVQVLADAAPAAAEEALRRLHDHASRHFADEDQELRMGRSGSAQCHIDEHAAVLATLRGVREEIAPAPDTPAHRALLRQLVAELRRWLPEHVEAMDGAVASLRIMRRSGGLPIVVRR